MQAAMVNGKARQFEAGMVYYGRFSCDYDSIVRFEIIKRTAKTAVLRNLNTGDVERKKIHQYDDEEFIAPFAGIVLFPYKIAA
jgi:hypothetical protein